MRPFISNPVNLRLAALLASALALSACGGGGSAGGSGSLSVDGPAPTTPPAPPTPPTGGGTGGGTTTPPAGGGTTNPTVPGPAPAPTIVASLAGVRALATNAADGSFFAVDGQGMLWRKQADAEAAAPLYMLGAFAVEGLAYAPQPNKLFLSVGGSQLATFDVDHMTLATIGAMGSYASVNGLEFDPQTMRLYGLDADTRTLLEIDMATAAVTAIGTLPAAYSQIEGLAMDPVTRRLYAADLASQRLLEIDTATAEVSERTRLPRASVAGLGYVAVGDRFLIADPAAGEIVLWDAKGNDINLPLVKGLDYDAQGRRMLGVHQGLSMLVEIDPATGWKAWIGWVGVGGIESLAVDSANGVAYGVDNAQKMLVRITLADGRGTAVGLLAGAVGSGSDIAGLTYDGASRTLYGVDGTSGALVSINPVSGATQLLGTLPMPGVRSLAFEPGANVLHAFSNGLQAHLTIDPATFTVQVEQVPGLGTINGLAFDAQNQVLWGTEAASSGLVQVWAPVAITVGFDDVRSLAPVGSYLVGFDLATDSLVRIDPATGAGELQAAVGPHDIEALAVQPVTGQLIGSDVRSGYLVQIEPSGGAVTFLGALTYPDVRGLAFTGDGVLYGVDRASRSLVAVNPVNGTCVLRADLTAYGLTDLQDLAWDVHTQRLIAVDAAQRRLVAINPVDNSVQEIGVLDATDVRAVQVEGPGVLVVLDRATDQLIRVDRFTGATLP